MVRTFPLELMDSVHLWDVTGWCIFPLRVMLLKENCYLFILLQVIEAYSSSSFVNGHLKENYLMPVGRH